QRPFSVQWFLHGYFHEEQTPERCAAAPTPAHWFARRFLTSGEAEFLALRGRALQERLEAGIRSMVPTVGRIPDGFVAPAWLYNDELIPALKALGIRFTESHFHAFDLATGRALAAPVLTWSTRSAARGTTSRGVAVAVRRLWTRTPLVRVALHPTDFDHPRIVASIARTLDALRAERTVMSYDDAIATAQSAER
ncbi:MAG TPA: hypothetical protein VH138_05890, partial [Vicinamibacterales bacterium]|nr:hypothetical protein [Vicinamibacterales bacterium]